MRNLYELELNREEVEEVIFAFQFLQEERDHEGFLPILSRELRAQRDQAVPGMTEILLDYQEEIRMAQQVDQRIEEEVKEYGDALDEVRLYTVELSDTDALTVIATLRHVARLHKRELIESVADTFQLHYNHGREPVVMYGTITEGTLKSSDIGPACLDWLKEHALEVYQEITSTFSDIYDLSLSEVDENFWDTDHWFLFETVYPAMHELAPDGYYFGTHPGDGSDIGFHQIDEEVV